MDLLTSAWNYFLNRQDLMFEVLKEHVNLVLWATFFTIIIGVPLGIAISRTERLRDIVLGSVSILYTIPILALFGFLIPIMGIGSKPALIALVVYGLLPVIRNSCVGIIQVHPMLKEAARGMGANNLQLLFRVEIPLAFPVIFAGIRTALVMNFSLATYAVFIGAGGMGRIIMQGIRTYNTGMLLAGILMVVITTVFLERLVGFVDNRIQKRFSLGD
ncbi:MAG: ABC transporter permease [Bacillota bacterium]|nr:ABC transporter permease [Bacillota bacterium]MDW7730078.1 ABC transporter permease [Bacillota bacterium]